MEQKRKFFSLTMAQNDDTPKKQGKILLFNKIYIVCKVTVITFDPMIYHTSRME